MKQLFRFWAVATLLFVTGCSKESLEGRVDDLEGRVQKLEQLCQQMNTNISSLQTIIAALQNNDYVTGVTPITENGKTLGYTITFGKAQSITLYHGKDGYTPQIGVSKYTDGLYYWTLDGKWLLDDGGKMILAQGQNGKDDITPQMKIEDNYWYVSYDNGTSWIQLGKATGEEGNSFFQDVTQDENNVYFTLADGTVITIPKGLALSIEFAEADLVVMSPNSTREIGYTVTSETETVKVEVTSSADIKAKVVTAEENGLTGKIHITTGAAIDEYSKVIVFVSNGDKVIMRSITFEEAGLVVEENATKQATAKGGEVVLEFLSNVECEVVVPEEAQSWIFVVPVARAMERQTITLKLEPNTGYYRSTTVTVQSSDSTLKLEYKVEQNGDLGINIDPENIPDNEIWYVMSDGIAYDVYQTTKLYGHQPFDAKVVSNIYQNGYGIIKFDAPVTKINDHTFGNFWAENMTELYLPDCIEYLGTGAIHHTGLSTLRIPKNLKQVDSYGLNNPNMESFSGEHVSADGKCVIIDGLLCGFAPKGIKEYTIPEGVKIINAYAFSRCEIENVNFPEGLEYIGGDAFCECKQLKSITLPLSLERLSSYAFRGCTSIEGFYGNENFHTPDHKCLIFKQDIPEWNGPWICGFAGHGLSEYTIPDGIVGIENYAFQSGVDLRSVTLPSSLVMAGGSAFYGCNNLEYLYGPHTSDDNKCIILNNELCVFIGCGIKEYTTPNHISAIGDFVFKDNKELQSLIITDNVSRIGSNSFDDLLNLRTLTLSANLELTCPIYVCPNLERVYCRSLIPPQTLYTVTPAECDKFTIYVPQQSVDLYRNSPYWQMYKIVGYEYTDLPEPNYYVSTDYSQDGSEETLQTATKGNGIDIVLMGDAYSDRQIADGTYKTDMEYIYNNLFTEEPYKSFKDYFNVHYVNVVSATEGYEHGNTALNGFFGDGTQVGGNDNAVFDYALNAISEAEMDEALLIVAMNSDNYAGTCYMYYPTSTTSTYGNGPSVAYFPKGGDAETFAQLLHHEACGHGFAKLADEYAYENMGAAPADYVSQTKEQQNSWGWWKNVDFTSDPSAIRWSRFINDTRYANEGLGAYEGGLTYWTGVWRPTDNSIMRYNTGGFNAPSREAIYYRIHKLAYGDNWEYNYEDFVAWDARNRTAAAVAARARSYKPANYKPTHPPVIKNKSWRDAK